MEGFFIWSNYHAASRHCRGYRLYRQRAGAVDPAPPELEVGLDYQREQRRQTAVGRAPRAVGLPADPAGGGYSSARARWTWSFSACRTASRSRRPSRFAANGVRVMDLSADFRLQDRRRLQEMVWQATHGAGAAGVVCVWPVRGESRANSRRTADRQPRLLPTSVNLGLYPLAKAGWLSERVIVDSKSSVSGAGRSLEAALPVCRSQ